MDKLRQFEVIGCGAPQMDRLVRRLHEEKIPDRLPPRRIRRRRGAVVEAQTNAATPLHLAVAFGHFGTVRDLVSDEAQCVLTADVNARDCYGYSPLHVAASRYSISPGEQHRTMELLLRHGAVLEARSIDGWTPLHLACLAGATGAVQLLLHHGARPNDPAVAVHPQGGDAAVPDTPGPESWPQAVDTSLWTAVHCAMWAGHVEVVLVLLDHAQSPGEPLQPDIHGASPLHWAAVPVMRHVVPRGPGPRRSREAPWTEARCPPPIPFAGVLSRAQPSASATSLRHGHKGVEERAPPPQLRLMRQTLPTRRRPYPGLGALQARRQSAQYSGEPPAAAHTARATNPGESGTAAVVEEDPAVDEARPSTEEAERAGPEGAEECAGAAEATLGGALAPPSWAAVAGCTGEDCFGAAFTSLLSGDDTLAAEILSGAGRRRGALAAARTDCEARRLSLLHVACMRGAADVAEQLLGLGADPGGRDAAGDTPLHLAIEGAATAPPQSTLRLVAALLAVGADAGARTGEGWPATLLAVLMGAPAAVLHLLAAHGADPNDAEPEEGLTPLHLAARAGDAATVRALLRAGARCNARDVQNRTPLFDALSADSVACAAVLVNLGANLDVIDARGWSPFAHGLRLVARGVGCSKRLLLLLADNGAWDARSTAATLMHQLQVTHFLKEARTRFHEQLASLRSQGLPHETPWAPYVRFAVPPQAQPACPLCKAEFGFFTPRLYCSLCGQSVCASCCQLLEVAWPASEGGGEDGSDEAEEGRDDRRAQWEAEFQRVLPLALLHAPSFRCCTLCYPLPLQTGLCRPAE